MPKSRGKAAGNYGRPDRRRKKKKGGKGKGLAAGEALNEGAVGYSSAFPGVFGNPALEFARQRISTSRGRPAPKAKQPPSIAAELAKRKKRKKP